MPVFSGVIIAVENTAKAETGPELRRLVMGATHEILMLNQQISALYL
jgi:hypothetical protein